MPVNNVEAFGISVETSLSAIANNPNFTGLVIVRSYSPDHYEGFQRAAAKVRGGAKLRFMDITEPFAYRPDGHRAVQEHRSEKGDDEGTNGEPPPQDCLHWCMPGRSTPGMSFCWRSSEENTREPETDLRFADKFQSL
uniref:Trichome birefringence-like C-terminal domain-containing protein n=1 Tax=Ananas comosus var. bracteatus TaxID=296719 RepID=A0A6V7Q6Q1_ANACO|nr:unnamed protein product [Ananas comosus var. bracteatus]